MVVFNVEIVRNKEWGDYNAHRLYFADEDQEIQDQDTGPDLDIDGNVSISASVDTTVSESRRASIVAALKYSLEIYTQGYYEWAAELLEDKEQINAELEVSIEGGVHHFCISMDSKSVERIRADIRYGIDEWATDVLSVIESGPSELETGLAFIEDADEREKYLQDEYSKCGYLDRTMY